MEAINNIVSMLNGPIWGVGMLVLIVGSGLYFTIRLGFFQFVHFKDMWSRIIDKSESESGISSFASFCTTMAMRVGTGNVAGVAVALYMGGPGALFWMIIAGMTNSAVCFTECTLSVLYKNRMESIWCILRSILRTGRCIIHAGSSYLYNLRWLQKRFRYSDVDYGSGYRTGYGSCSYGWC